MSNLIPTPRTDKNGRTVTRHMKPNGPISEAQGNKIPPATLKGSAKFRLLTSAKTVLMVALRKQFPESVVMNDLRKATPALATYSDVTLARIHNYPWTYQSARTLAISVTNDWTETTVNDYMAAATALDLTEGHSISGMHTDSWRLYDELSPANNDGDYPEERLNQIIALYRITEHMEDSGLETHYSYGEQSHEIESYYLDDDKLREFLLNPDDKYQRDDIVDLITTHNVYDVDQIKAMLDFEVKSLTSGVL